MTAQPYQPPARQPRRSRCSRWRIRRRAGRGLVEPLDDRLDHRRAQIRAPAPMALGMSTEERGIEHDLGERLLECLCDSRIEAGGATLGYPVASRHQKKGAAKRPLTSTRIWQAIQRETGAHNQRS